MRIMQGLTEAATHGQGLYEITRAVERWVTESGIRQGLLTLFIRHTSASLVIQENAAPEVKDDLLSFFRGLVPEEMSLYRHQDEGPDDMPAHIRSAVLPTQLSVPIDGGRLMLGTWQGIYVFEHRRAPHRREVVLHCVGD